MTVQPTVMLLWYNQEDIPVLFDFIPERKLVSYKQSIMKRALTVLLHEFIYFIFYLDSVLSS